jgi:heptosyltransferase I
MNASPPDSVCIFRLSALGDVTHIVPLVRRIQQFWPATRVTWIIGRFEHKLVGDIEGIEFIVVDKKRGAAAWRDLRKTLAKRRFDVLLQCQVSLRANILGSAVRAGIRVGFDWARSKELHSLFVNRHIAAKQGQHVLDALASFGTAIGLPAAVPRWDIPLIEADRAFAQTHLPGNQATLLISPCSSHRLRNWHAKGYAAVADYAQQKHGMRVLLCGGPSAIEREMGDAILASAREPITDLIGKDTLKQLLALLQRASAVLTPDAGPMHMANAVGTPVLGLHAATDANRSGPYSDLRWSINRYAEAATRFLGKPVSKVRWGLRIEFPGVMELIETEAVVERLDALMAWRQTEGLAR